MACILHPECNFLHSYLKSLLPAEMVNIDLKVKMMQGIHKFRQDRTSQVIKYNPRSTRLCSYLSLVRKMKTYLELEGRLQPKPRPQSQTQSTQNCPLQTQSQPVQPSTNPRFGKAPTSKTSDIRKRTVIAKRGYKVRVHNYRSNDCYHIHSNTNNRVHCNSHTSYNA